MTKVTKATKVQKSKIQARKILPEEKQAMSIVCNVTYDGRRHMDRYFLTRILNTKNLGSYWDVMTAARVSDIWLLLIGYTVFSNVIARPLAEQILNYHELVTYYWT